MKESIQPSRAASSALAPGLYLVATPIGNLRDITLRALDVLSAVDKIACEDSRVTARLLAAHGLKKPLIVYNDHSGERDRDRLIESLRAGARVALVSDAGTPLVSDPGYRLVRACVEENIPVTTLPGANAVLSALQLSALPSDRFSFGGFLPPRAGARRTEIQGWTQTPGSLVFYETAPRLVACLTDMLEILGNRSAAVVREITKMFEETRRGKLSDLVEFYGENGPPKGEIVIVVGPAEDSPDAGAEDAALEDEISKALKTLSLRDAVAAVCAARRVPRKKVYALALRLSQGSPDGTD